MAKSCTRLTNDFSLAGGTTATSASISPAANSAIVVAVTSYDGGSGNTSMAVSGLGLSWTTKINGVNYEGGGSGRVWVFVAYGSPSAGQLTFTFTVDSFVNWAVDNITGTVSSTPTNANVDDNNGTGTAVSATLGAFAHASNGTWAYCIAHDGVNHEPGTGFTEVLQNNAIFDWVSSSIFRDSNDTSVDLTLSGSALWGMVALEIVDTASEGGTVNTQTLSDTLTLADAGLVSKTSGRLGADTLTIADDLLISKTSGRVGSDSLLITDGPMEFFSVYGVVAISELTVSDDFLAWMRRHRLLEDNILITDELISSTIGYLIYSSILTSNVTVTDEALDYVYFNRLMESTLLTTDQILRALLVARDLLDGVEVTDSVLTAAQRFILLTDTISLEDALTALYVPPVGPATDNPVMRIGFDQPEVTIGGYSVN